MKVGLQDSLGTFGRLGQEKAGRQAPCSLVKALVREEQWAAPPPGHLNRPGIGPGCGERWGLL